MPSLHGYAISKGTKNPDLAWAFVDFCTAQKQAQEMADSRRILTAYTEVDKNLLARLEKDEPLAHAVIQTKIEHNRQALRQLALAERQPYQGRLRSRSCKTRCSGGRSRRPRSDEAKRKVAREAAGERDGYAVRPLRRPAWAGSG